MKDAQTTVGISSAYPPVNLDLRTRRIALFGLILTCLLSVLTLLAGIALLVKYTSDLAFIATSSAATRELFPISTTFIVTFCIEAIGFIHASSLRWALLSEERLEYNSYLRLFTATRKFGPNHWLVNLGVAIAIITTYMSTSSTFLPDFYTGSSNEYDGTGTRVNGVALITLGLSLGGQAFVGAWTIKRHDKDILSWSSNPMNTTLICLTNGFVEHTPGRCLRGLESPLNENAPVQPMKKQIRAGAKVQAHAVSLVTMLIVGIIYFAIGASHLGSDSSVGFLDTPTELDMVDTTSAPNGGAMFKYMLIVACCQTPLTISLHCAEIMVNLKRDEATWRSATSSSGTSYKSSAILAALKSPLTVYLFFFKAVLHWLFGQAVQVQYLNGWGLSGVEMLIMACGYLVHFFPFIIAARCHPKGAQPATYGHVKTIANLVDEWGEVIWWGDKGISLGRPEFRHAGTSAQGALPALQMDKLYQGMVGHM